MGWIDSGAWDPAQGKPLVELLAEHFSDEEVVRSLLQNARIPVRFLRSGSVSMELYWRGLAEDLHNNHLLGRLVAQAAVADPSIAQQLAVLDQVDAILAATPIADRYALRMLRPGNRPFINRVSLRGRLKELIEEGYPVLIVRGPERTGKSWSFELLQQVLPGDIHLALVDFSNPRSGRSATDLADLLYSRFALQRPSSTGRRTTGTRGAIELVHHFTALYNGTDRGKTVLFVDGLNRTDLKRDTLALASQLIVDVSQGQLKDVQLVLVGYADPFDAQYAAKVLVEDVVPLTRTDLQTFFEACASEAGKEVTSGRINEILQIVLKGAPTIREVGARSRTEALKLMGVGP